MTAEELDDLRVDQGLVRDELRAALDVIASQGRTLATQQETIVSMLRTMRAQGEINRAVLSALERLIEGTRKPRSPSPEGHPP